MPENPLDPSPETEHRIRERAYYLWQQDGSPHGRHDEYWERARELQGMQDSAGAGELPNPETHPTRNSGIDEAELMENLGEFPHAGSVDQGDRAETPMRRKKADAVARAGEDQIQGSPQMAESVERKAVRKKA